MALGVPGCPADGLDQGGGAAQKSLLVRVQDGHQRNLRNVQALPQQIDAHQHVEHVQAHVPDDLRPLQGVDVRVEVLHPDAHILHIIRQVLRHALGQGGHQHLVVLFRLLVDFADQIVYLAFHRAHVHLRIQQPRGPDDLLRAQQLMGLLIVRGGGGDEHHLVDMCLELLEVQGPVVQG